MDKDYQINYSKKKIISIFWQGIIVIAILGFMFLSTFENSNLITNVIGALLVFILSFSLIYILRKLREEAPGLEISQKGVLDNYSAFPLGTIGWKNIESIHVQKIRKQQFVVLKVSQLNKFFDQINFISRIFWKTTTFLFGNHVYISPNILDIEFEELVKIINQYHEKYNN